MHISALVTNASGSHSVTVAIGDSRKSLAVPGRDSGFGSGINGGELLMLALATCYCNDLYREAARLGVVIDSVEVFARRLRGRRPCCPEHHLSGATRLFCP